MKGKGKKNFPCILNSFISSSLLADCLPLYKFFNKRKFEWKKFFAFFKRKICYEVIYRTLLLPFGPMMIVKENSNFIDFFYINLRFALNACVDSLYVFWVNSLNITNKFVFCCYLLVVDFINWGNKEGWVGFVWCNKD